MAKIRGTDASDFLIGTNGDDEIDGEGGNDFILGRNGNDIIRGGAGNDFILAGRGDDIVDGGTGDDFIIGDRGDDIINGGDGNDFILAGRDDDTVDGGAGNDFIMGDRGADVLRGGAGDDTIDGGRDNDIIDGGAGNDVITGGRGADILKGGAGDDTIDGGRNNDVMDGGDGSDTYLVGGRRDGFDTIQDTGTGAGDYDVIAATSRNTRIEMRDFGPENGIEEISGNGNANVDIRGDNNANTFDFSATTLSGIREIDTRGGADTIIGSAGDDNIDAGSGSDSITGGAGNDFIDGGTGLDVAFYSGSIQDYDIQRSGGTTTITDLNASDGNDGSDTLRRVEVVEFSDYTLFLNQNNDPIAVDDTVAVSEDAGLNIAIADLLANDKEFDGDAIAFDGIDTSGTLGLVTVNGDGTLSYDPNGQFESLGEGESATDTFTYSISDGEGGFATGTVTVNIAGVNDAPVAEDDTATIAEDGVLEVTSDGVLSNDSDPDANDVLEVGAVEGLEANVGTQITLSSGALLTMNADGTYSYDPNGAFDDLAAGETATDTFTYTVSDGHGAGSATVEQSLLNESFDGGANGFSYMDDAFRATGEPAYADGTWGAGLGESGGGLQIMLGGQNNADIQGMSGGWQTTVTVPEDGTGGTLTFSYNMTLAPNYESDEFAQVMVSIDGVMYGADGNDFVAQLTGNGNGGSATTTGWQTFTVDLADLAPGDHTIIIGGYNNEKTFNDESVEILVDNVQFTTEVPVVVEPDTATVTVTITGVDNNEAPVADNDSLSVDEGAALSFDAADLLDGDTDADGDELSVSEIEGQAPVVGTPITLASGATVTLNADGSYSYDQNGAFDSLAEGVTGTDTFTYTVSDGNGGFDTATVTVTVTGVNDAPVADADGLSADEDVALTFNATDLLTGDTDVDNGDVLSISAINGEDPVVGTPIVLASGASVTLNADGTYSYDQNGAFNSLAAGVTDTDTFTYTVSDGNGGTDTQTVTVTVTGVNDAPVADADSLSADEDVALTFNATDLLTGDTDVDNGDVLSISAIDGQAPVAGTPIMLTSGASVTLNADGTYSYDQNGAFNSLAAGVTDTDTFTYTVSDGNGGTDTQTVTVTVTGVNDAPVADADSLSVDEDVALTFIATDLLTGDTDVDGGSLSVSEIEGQAPVAGTPIMLASGASVTLNTDGTYSYDQNGAFNSLSAGVTGTDTFTYTVSDGQGGTDTQTVTVTVTGTNDGPTAADDMMDAVEDVALTINVADLLQGDSDPDSGDVLTVTAIEGQAPVVGTPIALIGSGATVTLNADGTYSYGQNGAFDSLAQGATATDTFTYTVSDGNGGTSTATVTVTITGTNDAPVAQADSATVVQGGAIFVSAGNGLLANDSDVDDGSSLSVTDVDGTAIAATGVTLLNLPSGAMLVMGADGSYTYIPNGNTTTETFTYTVTDEHGATDTATVTIDIELNNQAPIAVADTGPDTVTEGAPVFVNGVLDNDMDPDGDSLTVTAVDGTPFDAGAGEVTVLTAKGAAVTMLANGHYTYDPNSQFEHLAQGQSETDTFTYTVDDGMGGTDTATVTITINGVNDAPVADADGLAVAEDVTLTFNATDLLTGDTDIDNGDVLSISAIQGQAPVAGTPIALASGASVTLNADGSYSYDQNGAFDSLAVGVTGTDTFTYTVSDGNGGTDTQTVTVTVTGVNDAPVADADGLSVNEDVALTFNATDLLAGDTDVDNGDVLSISAIEGQAPVVGTPIALASGASVTLNADGTYSYDQNGTFDGLAAGATGTDSFTYTVSDGNGGTDTQTVTVTVTGVNDAPVADADSLSVAEDVALTFNATDLLTGDTDVDGGALSVSAIEGQVPVVGTPIALASGASVTLNADGSYSYDQNGAFNSLAVGATGTDTFTYTVSDGNGGTDTQTVTVTVSGVNDAPTADADGLAVNEDVALTFDATDLLTGDTDPDSGDVLSVSAIEGQAPVVGTPIALASGASVTLNADGTYSYDQNGAFNSLAPGATGTDTFTYTVSDGNGGTDTQTVTVTVTGVNDGPVADADSLSVNEDVALTFNATDLLTGDTDVDGGTLSVSAIEGQAPVAGTPIALASGASVTLNADGSYSYDQNGAFNSLSAGVTGTDTFTYTVSDGQGGTDTATVTVTVTGVNDAPVADADSLSVAEDVALTFNATDLLTGDTDPDSGDVLSVSAIEGQAPVVGTPIALASGASVTLNADGSYSYDQNGAFNGLAAGATGTDSFTYTVSDGNGGTDTQTVTVTVTGVNDGPVADADSLSVNEDVALTFNATDLLTGDTDVDGDTLSISAIEGQAPVVGTPIALASGASVTLNADGSYSYDQNGAFNSLAVGVTGTDSFTYTVSDGNGGTDTQTVTVTVTGVNDAPVADADGLSVAEDVALTFNATDLLTGDTDPDSGDVLSVSAIEGQAPVVGTPIALASGASVTLNADGSYSYDQNGAFDGLAAGATGTDTFTYTVSDGNGGTDTQTVTVTINGVNDGPVADADSLSVNEDVALTFNATDLLTGDTDVDGDSLSISAIEGQAPVAGTPIALASGASVTLNADGTYSYDQNGAFNSLAVGVTGTDTFTYTVSDGNGGFDTATVTVTVTGVNDAPVADADGLAVAEDVALTFNATDLLTGDTDPDSGDVLSVSAIEGQAPVAGTPIALASGASVTLNADGSYSYDQNGAFNSLAPGATGTDTFTYTVSDGNGGTDTQTVTVTVTGVNDAPVADADSLSVDEDVALTFNATDMLTGDTDVDGGSLSVSAIEGQAPVVGTPIALASGASVTLNADGTYSYDQNGAFNSLSAGVTGTDTFTYTVSDGQGGTDTQTVTVTVTGVNDAPTADADGLAVNEDVALTFNATDLLTGDTDPDSGDVLSISAIQGQAPVVGTPIALASGASVTLNADGTYSYDQNGIFESLAPGVTATDSFTYTVSDGNGGTDTQTVTVTVTGVNDGPVADADSLSAVEDTALIFNATDLLTGDTDVDGGTLSVSAIQGQAPVVGTPIALASGASVTLNADGTYSYVQNGAFDSLAVGVTGTDTFTYTVSDGQGGTDTATVTVTVTGTNDGPVATADLVGVGEDDAAATTGNLLGNDNDVDVGDVMAVTSVQTEAGVSTAINPASGAVGITLAMGGVLTISSDGSYSYDPNGEFNGLTSGQTATETVTYTVSDGNGGTDTATVTFTVTGTNDGPVAVADVGTTDENTVLTVPADGVLANDSDADVGDTFTVTAVEGLGVGTQIPLASGALLTMNADGSYSYDPNGQFQSLMDGQTATDTFTYTITDSQGATDTASVTVTITGVSNSDPIAVNDAVSVSEDAVHVVPADGLMANDTDADVGDTMSITAVQGSTANVGSEIILASGARLTVNADGGYTYDTFGAFDHLDVGQTAVDTFTYTVTDSLGASDTATVTVTVDGVNDAPVAVADTYVIGHTNDFTDIDSPTILQNDFDPEGSAITLLSIDGQPVDFSTGGMTFFFANGDAVTFNDDLSLSYEIGDPAAADLLFGEVLTTGPLEYVIQDASGATTTGSIDFVIANATFLIGDLDGTNGFAVNGVGSTDLSGHSVSGAGDVNGDGYDDFIIGAFQADTANGANTGSSYVVFGDGTGSAPSLNLSTLDGTNGFALHGAAVNQFTGRSVGGAGDVNGDGFADVIIGSRDEAGPETAYVVFGSDAGFAASMDLGTLNGTNGFAITGIDADFSDITVGSAGDVNGDGIADMIIGSNGAEPGGLNTGNIGESYIVFGQAGGFGATLDVSSLDGTNGFTVVGSDIGDNTGFAVSSAGDLNNDGYDDVVVGAIGGDPGGVNNAGEAYVVYGGASGLPSSIDVSSLNGTNGFVINGALADGQLGNAVSSAGDINGDGIDDLVVGARGTNYDTGGAYVVFGQTGGLGASVDVGNLDGTNGFRIVGTEQNAEAGFSVSLAGDFNGDGFEDIIIGAPGVTAYDEYYNPVNGGGESYIVFGSADGFGATLNLNQLDGRNGFVIDGVVGQDALGTSVSGAGDLNGDGYDDLIIGAPKEDVTGRTDTGASYIMYGSDLQGNVSHQGTAAADTLTGDAGANTMIGGQGDDFLSGAGGMDVLYGGAGNDTLAISDLAPQRIDGGSGEDVLQIDGASLAIDMGSLPISGIEAVDITGTGDNSLTLNVMDVLSASDTSNVLKVLGDLGDQVVAEGGWVSTGQQLDNGVMFDVYTSGQATLMVDTDINTSVVIV